MTDKNTHNPNRRTDDQLADFADQVLSAKGAKPISSEDPELAELTETVTRLKAAVNAEQPDPALKQRVRQKTRRVWEQEFRRPNPAARPSLLEQLRKLFSARPVLQWALVAALILLFVALSQPSLYGGLPASALGGNAGVWLVLVFIVVGIGLYLWLSKK